MIDTHNSGVHYEVKKNELRRGDVRPSAKVCIGVLCREKKLSNKREFHEHRLYENHSLIPDVNKFQN
jgi:hypothetical protein